MGAYNSAKVFTESLEESARVQIERLCDQSYAAGCTIGTTMTIGERLERAAARSVCPKTPTA